MIKVVLQDVLHFDFFCFKAVWFLFRFPLLPRILVSSRLLHRELSQSLQDQCLTSLMVYGRIICFILCFDASFWNKSYICNIPGFLVTEHYCIGLPCVLYNFLLGYLACCSCNFCFLKKWNLQGLGFSLIWQSKLLWLESWKVLLMPVIFLTCRFWFGLKARWTQAPSRIVSLSGLPACL